MYTGPKGIREKEVPIPALKPGEILIQVKAAGICGSELEGYLGHSSVREAPLIPDRAYRHAPP